MSIHVASLVKRRSVGSPTRKAVLMHMADYASDDGSGVWTSKSKMAEELEMGRRTVQECIDSLIEAGLIEPVGKHAIRNGYTDEYRLVLDRIKALPEVGTVKPKARQKLPETTCAGAARVREPRVTCAGAAQQDVREPHINRPRTILEPSNGGGGSAREAQLEESTADLIDRIVHQLGLDRNGIKPKYWAGADAPVIVGKWVRELRLSPDEILHVVRANHVQFGTPASGPRILTQHMEAYAGARDAPPLQPREGGQARASPPQSSLADVAARALAQLHAEDERKARRQ